MRELRVLITMDQHKRAFTWLEEHLVEPIFQVDVDDIIAMEEQLTAQ